MSGNKERKFLFDTNNFDLPDQPPTEEVYIEPPPIFSLDELGFARDEAFEKGRQAGLAEASKQREQYLAELVDRIGQELKFLTGAENYRSAVYEREVLSLTETIFRAVFPYFTQSQGTEEIKSIISKVLANITNIPSITVEIPQDDLKEIEHYFKTFGDVDSDRVTFKPSSQISRGSCTISWKDGGALRDHQIIADEVLKALHQASKPVAPSYSEEASSRPSSMPALDKEVETGETELDSQGE